MGMYRIPRILPLPIGQLAKAERQKCERHSEQQQRPLDPPTLLSHTPGWKLSLLLH
jgi:hypothetical protein